MTDLMIKALADLGIEHYRILENRRRSAELFFVRRRLDMRRMTDVREFNVTVFVDEGETRGEATASLTSTMSEGELRSALLIAREAARSAQNPFYELAEPIRAERKHAETNLRGMSLADAATAAAEALFAADTDAKSFLNSTEVFATETTVSLMTSEGTDVSWDSYELSGEFVVQCKTDTADVETYHSFSYRSLEEQELTRKAREALSRVSDRAVATPTLASGSYDVILSDEHVGTVLSYYVDRANAHMLHPGYSSFRIGESVQPSGEGERLSLTLRAVAPYSAEGIEMIDRPLVRDGKLETVHGSLPLCRYLGVTPTGSYRSFSSENGTVPFSEMIASPSLWVVAFSDFQMDEFSGHFAGEIRLAYLIRDGKMTPVTGGSINGSILDLGGRLLFSKERYESLSYSGPRAVRIPDVPVAGV